MRHQQACKRDQANVFSGLGRKRKAVLSDHSVSHFIPYRPASLST